MSVKNLDTGNNIELIDDKYLRTTITAAESLAISNKKRVFRETAKHFTQVNEKDDENIPDTKELYYKISVEDGRELPLDSFRLMARDAEGKQMILDGLLEMLLLISEGKIYDVELNPLNFVAEDKPSIGRVYIKSFYRRDRGLREITDTWLENAKKILGYFLIADTGINESNFNRLSSADIYNEMSGSIAEQYLKILKSTSIDMIARDWFTEDVYKQIKGFPPIMADYREPKDVTEISEVLLGGTGRNSLDEDDEDDDYDFDVKEELESGEFEEVSRRGKRGEGLNYKKTVLFGILFIIGIGLGGFFGMKLFGGFNKVETVEVPKPYYEGMIQASVQKYKDASEEFDLLTAEDMEMLGENEKLTIYISYLKGGEFDKALQIDPEGAETVIMYLEKRDQLSDVMDINSDLPAIQFEQAVIEKDYAKIVELKGEVRDTEERQMDVIKALVLTGDVTAAVEYAKEKELNGLEKTVRGWYNEYAEGKDIAEEDVKVVDEKIKELP